MTTEIKIEKNIPVPSSRNRLSRSMDALRKMKVGDSFIAAIESRSNWSGMAARLQIKVATRKEGDKMRVWRIA